MVQATSAIIVAAVAFNAASTLAVPVVNTDVQEVNAREIEDRGFLKLGLKAVKGVGKILGLREEQDELLSREFDDILETREFQDEELSLRELDERGFLKMGLKAVKGVGKILGLREEQDELIAREFDDALETRDLQIREDEEFIMRELEQRGLGKIVKKVGGFLSNFIREEGLTARDFEDDEIAARTLEERGFGKILKKVGGFVSNFIREEGLMVRDFDDAELEQRGFGKILKKVGGFVSNFIREEGLDARDFDEFELEQRGFGKILKKVGGFVSNFIREENELAVREYNEELLTRELDERGFGKIIKKVGGFLGNFIREEDGIEARDYNLEELD